MPSPYPSPGHTERGNKSQPERRNLLRHSPAVRLGNLLAGNDRSSRSGQWAKQAPRLGIPRGQRAVRNLDDVSLLQQIILRQITRLIDMLEIDHRRGALL